MAEFKTVTERFSAAGQLTAEDFQAAADAGFTMVINNRPDGEEPGILSVAEAQALAAQAGLAYRHIPIASGSLPMEAVAATAEALAEADGPVLGHCRSGMRSTALWAAASVKNGSHSTDEVIAAAGRAGYNLTPLQPLLDGLG